MLSFIVEVVVLIVEVVVLIGEEAAAYQLPF